MFNVQEWGAIVGARVFQKSALKTTRAENGVYIVVIENEGRTERLRIIKQG